jgi:hypothetical protein
VDAIVLAPASNRSSDTPGVLRSNESAEPGAVANKKSNWQSTTSATAKLLLRGVRDSADAFGPLKSVASGLCFVLENCEVRPSCTYCLWLLQALQRMKANKQAIESLAPRVKVLAESLCAPVSEGDTREESRRKALGW